MDKDNKMVSDQDELSTEKSQKDTIKPSIQDEFTPSKETIKEFEDQWILAASKGSVEEERRVFGLYMQMGFTCEDLEAYIKLLAPAVEEAKKSTAQKYYEQLSRTSYIKTPYKKKEEIIPGLVVRGEVHKWEGRNKVGKTRKIAQTIKDSLDALGFGFFIYLSTENDISETIPLFEYYGLSDKGMISDSTILTEYEINVLEQIPNVMTDRDLMLLYEIIERIKIHIDVQRKIMGKDHIILVLDPFPRRVNFMSLSVTDTIVNKLREICKEKDCTIHYVLNDSKGGDEKNADEKGYGSVGSAAAARMNPRVVKVDNNSMVAKKYMHDANKKEKEKHAHIIDKMGVTGDERTELINNFSPAIVGVQYTTTENNNSITQPTIYVDVLRRETVKTLQIIKSDNGEEKKDTKDDITYITQSVEGPIQDEKARKALRNNSKEGTIKTPKEALTEFFHKRKARIDDFLDAYPYHERSELKIMCNDMETNNEFSSVEIWNGDKYYTYTAKKQSASESKNKDKSLKSEEFLTESQKS